MTIEAPAMPVQNDCPWKPGYVFTFDLGPFSRIAVANYVTDVADPNLIHGDARAVEAYCRRRQIEVRKPGEWIVPGMMPLDYLPGCFVKEFGQGTVVIAIKPLLFVGPLFTGELVRAACEITSAKSVSDTDWQLACKVRTYVPRPESSDSESNGIAIASGSAVFQVPKPESIDETGLTSGADLMFPPLPGEDPALANH
ncbi:MAG TPA: hypothetical protein VG934_01185 [Candidatus Paceibacterota bacterium]|nr:hypothetical protein [Candidatus Paceibacterota bacterium]